jgi:hypothetical protein
MKAQGIAEDEIYKTLRANEKFAEKFKKWPKLISGKEVTLPAEISEVLTAMNYIRGDLTHAKSFGHDVYEKLEKVDLQKFVDSIAEYTVQLTSAIGEIYPYWIFGWNYVNVDQSSLSPFLINDQQFVHSLGYLGVAVDSFDSVLSEEWRRVNMRDLAGYRKVKQILANCDTCEPIDPDFQFRPRLCKRWWDIQYIKTHSKTAKPQTNAAWVGTEAVAVTFISPIYNRKEDQKG